MTRPSRLLSLALLTAAFAAVGSQALAAPSYQVVLANGERLSASSRPLMAMGKVSFLDESRRPVTLPSSIVNVEATRASLGGSRASGKVWDERALGSLDRRGVQFYGDAPPPSEPEGPAGVAAGEIAAPGDGTDAERLRAQIELLSTKIRALPTSDRQRSLMVMRQAELQQELTRVQSPAPARG